jgi:predicted transcriptional regulator
MNSTKSLNLKLLVLKELDNYEIISGSEIRNNLKARYSVEISEITLRTIIRDLRKTYFIIATNDGYKFIHDITVINNEEIRNSLKNYLENRCIEIAREQIIVNTMKSNFNKLIENKREPSLFDNGGHVNELDCN